VRTEDELVLTGILVRENEDALVLQSETEEVVVARSDVAFQRLEVISMMPEGQLATLTEDEVTDLVAYLRSDTQVPRLATKDNASELFDGDPIVAADRDRSGHTMSVRLCR
jgi:hypothetical protein